MSWIIRNSLTMGLGVLVAAITTLIDRPQAGRQALELTILAGVLIFVGILSRRREYSLRNDG